MKVYVYVTNHPTDLVADLINRLDAAGIAFFIDKHIPTREWYKTNMLQGNCRVFNSKYDYFDEEFPEEFVPFILCAADYDETPNWLDIQKSLIGESISIPTAPIQKIPLKRHADEEIDEKTGASIQRIIEPKKSKDSYHYELETYYDKYHNTMLYQMTRPGDDERPWTCVITDYSQRGHSHFFSSFFKLQSFGTVADIDFLTHCWEKWHMPGPFNLEDLVKAHIKEAEEDEAFHPIVYVNDIKSLILLFNTNSWP